MIVVNGIFHGMVLQVRAGRDLSPTGVSARRVISPTAPAQHHSQATYLADGALGVKGHSSLIREHSRLIIKLNFRPTSTWPDHALTACDFTGRNFAFAGFVWQVSLQSKFSL